MNMKYIPLMFGAALLAGCQTTGGTTGTINAPVRTTTLNTPILIGHSVAVNPDCSSRGTPTIRVITPPANGKLTNIPRVDYVRAGLMGDYAHCNIRKTAGLSHTYAPNKGFVGTDSASVEMFFPGGITRTFNLTFVVK